VAGEVNILGVIAVALFIIIPGKRHRRDRTLSAELPERAGISEAAYPRLHAFGSKLFSLLHLALAVSFLLILYVKSTGARSFLAQSHDGHLSTLLRSGGQPGWRLQPGIL
jgi:hypothetical protein